MTSLPLSCFKIVTLLSFLFCLNPEGSVGEKKLRLIQLKPRHFSQEAILQVIFFLCIKTSLFWKKKRKLIIGYKIIILIHQISFKGNKNLIPSRKCIWNPLRILASGGTVAICHPCSSPSVCRSRDSSHRNSGHPGNTHPGSPGSEAPIHSHRAAAAPDCNACCRSGMDESSPCSCAGLLSLPAATVRPACNLAGVLVKQNQTSPNAAFHCNLTAAI